MKVAIATAHNSLTTVFDEHFGRCRFFYIFDTETKEGQFMENPGQHQEEKAGSEAAQAVKDAGVAIVVAGRFGSKVVEIFRQSGIQMVIPQKQQTVQEIVGKFK